MNVRQLSRIDDKYLVVVGQAVGQLALLAVTPILTRAFAPSELGVYQVAMAIALVLQPLATLRHEWVIPVAKSAGATRTFVRRAVIAIALTNGACLIGAAVMLLVGNTTVGSSLFMVAFVNLAYSLAAVDNAMLIRSHSLRRLALRNLISGVAASVLQLSVALLAPHAILIAAAVLVGRLVAVVVTRVGSTTIQTIGDGEDSIAYGPIRMAVTIASGCVSSAALQGLTLTAAATLGSASAAYVATAQRVAATPAALMGQGIGQAVQASAARTVNSTRGRLGRNVGRASLRLGIFAVVVGAAIAGLGPLLAVPVLGAQWAAVGAILPIMALPVVLQLVVGSLSPVLVMIGNETAILLLNVLRLVAGVGAGILVALLTHNMIATVAAYSVAIVVCYVLHLAVIAARIRKFDRQRNISGQI